MGIQTEFLETDQLHDEIQYLVDLLISLDVQQVLVLYGVGCTTEQLYDPIPVPVSDLATFIQASIDHGIFHLGDDDLYVEAVTPPCQFLLCHEHDLHLESADQELLRKVEAAWIHRGYTVVPSTDT